MKWLRIVLGLAAASQFVGADSSQLEAEELLWNSSFEQGTGEPFNPYGIRSWTGYGNQEQTLEHTRSGTAAVKMFGGAGHSGLYQVIPLPPGVRLHVSGWFLLPGPDALGGTAHAAIRVEFLGRSPVRVDSLHMNEAMPFDAWQLLSFAIHDPSPIGVGRLVAIWSDGAACSGSIYWDQVSVEGQFPPGVNLVSNAGFESGEGGLANPSGVQEWIAFGNAERSTEMRLEGGASLKLFGGFGYSGAFHDFRFEPQMSLLVSANCLTRAEDRIAGSATSHLAVEWPGPIVGVAELPVAPELASLNQWFQRSSIAAPPTDAIAARIVVAVSDGAAPGGAVYADDVSALAVLPGDTDGDGRLDARDISGFIQTLIRPESVSTQAWAASDIGRPGGPCAPDGSVSIEDSIGFVHLILHGSCAP